MNKIEAGKLAGPRVLTSGGLISPTGGPGYKMQGTIRVYTQSSCFELSGGQAQLELA